MFVDLFSLYPCFRAWVPVGQVYLLSKDPPVSIKKGRGGYDQSMEELNLHIQRLKYVNLMVTALLPVSD